MGTVFPAPDPLPPQAALALGLWLLALVLAAVFTLRFLARRRVPTDYYLTGHGPTAGHLAELYLKTRWSAVGPRSGASALPADDPHFSGLGETHVWVRVASWHRIRGGSGHEQHVGTVEARAGRPGNGVGLHTSFVYNEIIGVRALGTRPFQLQPGDLLILQSGGQAGEGMNGLPPGVYLRLGYVGLTLQESGADGSAGPAHGRPSTARPSARRRRGAARQGARPAGRPRLEEESRTHAGRSDFAQYDAAVPLKPTFRFSHEPVSAERAEHFVGRQDDLYGFVERVLFSEGGSFLVTGYRGVGKTSFVNQAVRDMARRAELIRPITGPLRVLPIHFNLARPLLPAELMHHIIRRLYDRLNETNLYALLDRSLQERLALAYRRTSVNMTRKRAEASERNIGLSDVALGIAPLNVAGKAAFSLKTSTTDNQEYTFLGYDDKSAEQDIIDISRALSFGFPPRRGPAASLADTLFRRPRERVRLKIVFVFDELDKLEDYVTSDDKRSPVIDDILSALKNLFTTSGICFVFVAGKDLHDRWLEDVGKGDSIYESVFSYDKYLPCMWQDITKICDAAVDWAWLAPGGAAATAAAAGEAPREGRAVARAAQTTGAAATSGSAACPACGAPRSAGSSCPECGGPFHVDVEAEAGEALDQLRKCLVFRGRGIPRRLIRAFNEHVVWSASRPLLAFTPQERRRIRLYAGLCDVLTENDARLFGDSRAAGTDAQNDRRRLAVYYLVDWMLRQGTAEFSFEDVATAAGQLSAKIAPTHDVAPGIIRDLLRTLVEHGYLQEIAPGPDVALLGNEGAARAPRYRVPAPRLAALGGQPDAADLPAVTVGAGSDLRFGRYRVLEQRAAGGMGTVYRAVHETTGQLAAIKVLQGGTSPGRQLVERFKREAHVLRSARHQNIVRYLDFGQQDERWYLAMEWVDGPNLAEVLRVHHRLPLDAALSIVKPAVQALQHVHRLGFVRIDVKPSNILLDSRGQVYLADFGTATTVGGAEQDADPEWQTLTEVEAVIGTPKYMAPEQFGGDPVDGRVDVFAVGVVLYETLTGRRPPAGSSHDGVAVADPDGQIDPPPQDTSLPGGVEDIVLRCLARDPDRRYQDMGALALALAAASDGTAGGDVAGLVTATLRAARRKERADNSGTVVLEATPFSVEALPQRLDPTISPAVGPPRASSGFGAGPVPAQAASPAPPVPSLASQGDVGRSSITLYPPDRTDTQYGQDAPRPPSPLTESGIRASDRVAPSGAAPPPPDAPGSYLEVVQALDGSTSRRLRIRPGRQTIGRNSENDLLLVADGVSRFHATLITDGEGVWIEDANSINGTLVNDERIRERRLLRDGDTIRLGACTLIFREAELLEVGVAEALDAARPA